MKHLHTYLKRTPQTRKGSIAMTNRAKKPTKRILLGIFGIALSVSLAQLVLGNYFATKGQDLSEILAKKESLKEENDILKTEVAKATSLSSIAEKAKNMGFQRPKDIVFITAPQNAQPVAFDTSGNVVR